MSRPEAKLAAALARTCHLTGGRLDDAVQEAYVAMSRAPRRRKVAAAAGVVRRHVALQLGVAARTLPRRLARLKAIAGFEAERGRCRPDGLHVGSLAQFDAHSRAFARANGVCPRCARPGDFDGQTACACGWRG